MLDTPDTTPAERWVEEQKTGAARSICLKSAGRATPDTACYFLLNYTENPHDIRLPQPIAIDPATSSAKPIRAPASLSTSATAACRWPAARAPLDKIGYNGVV
jgi:hypothetical protein